MKAKLLFTAITALVLNFFHAQSLDTTFGNAGVFTHSIPGEFEMFVLPNGKIIVHGATDSSSFGNAALVFCLNPDGTIDTSFGTNGFFSMDIAPNNIDNYESFYKVDVDSSGRIILLYFNEFDNGTAAYTAKIVRL